MTAERRCITRKRPGGISYFEFEAGSGGIVLDASEKGLAFQAADAVQQLGSRRIFVSPHPGYRIELNAEVVWMDGSKKTGGLRFIDPGADSYNRVRDWLKQTGEPGVSQQGQEHPLPTRAVEEVPSIPGGSSNPDTSPIPLQSRIEAREQRPVEPRLAPILPPLFNPDSTWQSPNSSGVRRGFLHHIATGFLIAAFVFACVALAENFGFVGRFRPKLANALIRLGEKLNGTADSQSRNSSPLPGLAQVPPQAPSAGKPIPDAPQPEAPASSDQVNSSPQNNSVTPSLAIPRAKQDAYHSAYSPTPRFAQERSVDANRLWSAVGAGSSAAEVDLARLYLKGEGVPRNCEQARILLRAAAKSGSREARQQLQKLRTYGCR
jgi:PilZ domain